MVRFGQYITSDIYVKMEVCHYHCQIFSMKCGLCKEEIIRDKRREHLRYHKLDDTLVEWLIVTDDDLISLYEKH